MKEALLNSKNVYFDLFGAHFAVQLHVPANKPILFIHVNYREFFSIKSVSKKKSNWYSSE